MDRPFVASPRSRWPLTWAILTVAGCAVASGGEVCGDSVIRAAAGGSEIVITTTSRVAGAIHSLTWNGREFVDSHDHGRQVQSASNLDVDGRFHAETFNPTEAGCERDMAGPTSTSRLLWLSASGRDLLTVTQMAFWLRPGQSSGGHPALNTTALSNHLLHKEVRIGMPGLEHAIRHVITFTLPAEERHRQATFEALTGYMPEVFAAPHGLRADGTLTEIGPGPGEQPLPVILSTGDGSHAMGVYSPSTSHARGRAPGFGRFFFSAARVSKWNCVFREEDPAGLQPGTYRYIVYTAVGTLEQVRRTLHDLRSRQADESPHGSTSP